MNVNMTSVLIVFLHDLFTAVWIGGLIAIGLTALPAARKALGKGPQMKQLMDNIVKRQSVLVYISVAALTITGLIQAKTGGEFGGLFSFNNLYSTLLSLKHVIMLLMVAIALTRSLILGKPSVSKSLRVERLSAFLIYSNMVLGVAVLLLSALLATI
jgi:putative copper export protein